jgi:hypothetical protein
LKAHLSKALIATVALISILLGSAQVQAAGERFLGGIAVHPMPDGRLEAFAVGAAGSPIYHKYQITPNGGWSAWKSMGGATLYPSISVAPNQDGRLTIFVKGTDNGVWFKYQTMRNNPESWTTWYPHLGKPGGLGIHNDFGAPVAVLNGLNRIEIFAQNSKYILNRRAQIETNGAWGNWGIVTVDSHAYIDSIAAARDAEGKVMFTNERYYFRQAAVGSSTYEGGFPFGKSLPLLAVKPDARGYPVLVGADYNNDLYYTHMNPGGGLSGWVRMDNGRTGYKPAMVLDARGCLAAFVHGADDRLYFSRQSEPGFPGFFGIWYTLGGKMFDAPAVAMNQDGRLEAFVLGTEGRIYHNYELSPRGAWSGFREL